MTPVTMKNEPLIEFPPHKCSLTIEHNKHRDYYQSPAEAANETNDGDPFLTWKDEGAKARAIATDEIWTMTWYPDTPVGSYRISAPTLPELLAFAAEVAADDAKRT